MRKLGAKSNIIENLPLCSMPGGFDGPTAKDLDEDEPCFGDLIDAKSCYC